MKTRGTQPYLLCNCSYIQQLREGVHNFFVTFIEVLRDRPPGHDWELEPGVTCGDYLFGMLHVQHFIFFIGCSERMGLHVGVELGVLKPTVWFKPN